MNTLDVVSEIIVENSDIEFLTFSKYPQQTLIQNEIALSKSDEKLVAAALEIRNKFRLPFWDSLMLSFFDQENISTKLLSSALVHNKNAEKIKTCDIREIKKILNISPEQNISLNSEINFKDNTIKHLYLLDFHIYPSANNLIIISEILHVLGLHGYILDSGESYHFISNSFFDLEIILDLLAKSLLFAPIVDRAWVAHQLLERSCSLRVGIKHGIMPTVIKKV